MHLSKILIPWQKANNPYDIHRELWRLFPNRPYDDRNFLFRVEKKKKYVGAEVLMQSEQEPQDIDGHYIAATRQYEPIIDEGQRLRFRLRANPVKKISDESGRLNSKGDVKKCRVPLIREEEQKSWFERKVDSHCTLDTLIINQEVPLYFRKKKGDRTGKIQTVIFDGILTVKDPSRFMPEVRKGIGPAKAFGCGLLSIAKL